jgi:hypothetical protein
MATPWIDAALYGLAAWKVLDLFRWHGPPGMQPGRVRFCAVDYLALLIAWCGLAALVFRTWDWLL